MPQQPRPTIHVASGYQPVLRELGIDAESLFEHPLIKPWRTLSDRENCSLDAALSDGQRIRWHIKRYAASRGPASPADAEVAGHRALINGQVPTAALVAWGRLPDRRSFVIFEDLAGYEAGDKLVASGTDFERLLAPTADLAARLHQAGLHHRDLYLCHFFARRDGPETDVRLIDTARVRQLPRFIARNRWIVKDLAQFWYSTLNLPIADAQRTRWLQRYAEQRQLGSAQPLRRRIERKAAWIAKHDAALRREQPNRNVSIPD